MKNIVLLSILACSCFAQEYYDRGKLVRLSPEQSVSKTRSGETVRWYRNDNGVRLGVTDELIVQWKNPSRASAVLQSLGIKQYEWLTSKLMNVTVPAGREIFALSKQFSEQADVQFAHPNFIQERKLR